MQAILFQSAKRAYDFAVARSPLGRTQTPSSAPSRSTNVIASILSPFEAYVVSLQSLLIWEKPYLSATSFVCLNCLFWLVVSWNRRFLSVLALSFLAVFVYKAWVTQIWPEIKVPVPEDEDTEEWTPVNPQVLSVPELGRYINEFCNKIVKLYNNSMKLRQTNHGMFCLFGLAACIFFAFLGHMVPGVLLIYSLVLGLSLGPGIALHLIPATIYDQIAGIFVDYSSPQTSLATDTQNQHDADTSLAEFLPETSASILKQLSLPPESMDSGEFSLQGDMHEENIHHRTLTELGMESFISESEESSLCIGLGRFPSVEEENESDIEDEDLPEMIVQKPEVEKSSIQFVATHFKDDTSESDSDAAFTEGLSFATAAEKKDVSEPLKDDDSKMLKTKVSSSSDIDDDELEDFEILERTDIS